ncbi:hypothetical protein AB0C65_35580 [Nocardia sp. NPDC048505]|uniref:hypothetical protein n=1 Tax=Nocardia sp. NPDC048505 TaxID=3155756 RepID=UPI00340DECC2
MTEALPRACRRDDRVVTRGYVVGFSGKRGLGETLLFCADLEPAVALARAVRMSFDADDHSLRPAAREMRDHPARDGSTVVTLYIDPRERPRDHAPDLAVLGRWIRGVDGRTNCYMPPERR